MSFVGATLLFWGGRLLFVGSMSSFVGGGLRSFVGGGLMFMAMIISWAVVVVQAWGAAFSSCCHRAALFLWLL